MIRDCNEQSGDRNQSKPPRSGLHPDYRQNAEGALIWPARRGHMKMSAAIHVVFEEAKQERSGCLASCFEIKK